MSHFQALIEKLGEFQRRYAKIKTEFAALDRLFLDEEASASARAPTQAAALGSDNNTKQVVKFLKDVGRAVPPAEVALGINLPNAVAHRHLTVAVKRGFVERVGHGLYQVVDAVKET